MPVYYGHQFYHDWRYAIEKDFLNADNEPFNYAEDGKRRWGDELKRLDFDSSPIAAIISPDHRYFAVSVNHDIHIFDGDFKFLFILKGHTSRVDFMAFNPGDSNILVSCESNNHGGSVPTKPTILFWNLREYKDSTPNEIEMESLCQSAMNAVADRLAGSSPPVHLNSGEKEALVAEIKPCISKVLIARNASGNPQIHGRLQTSFKSNVFSPSGRYMLYLPGDRPPSNGDDQWDVRVYSTETSADYLTLTGHRDALMWMGYDSTETLIGTVAWDKTMRIWNSKTGDNKYTFPTEGQNWTGGFSPDSKLFVGTCGRGTIHIYSLDDGSEIFKLDVGKGRWCRRLDWSPDSRKVAVGSNGYGKLFMIDVYQQKIVQERILSMEKSKFDDGRKDSHNRTLEVSHVSFVDNGRKLAQLTSGDGSAEVYDLKIGEKWRFARDGTESYGEETVSSKIGGHSMAVWEDKENNKLMLATVDANAVRIWSIALTRS